MLKAKMLLFSLIVYFSGSLLAQDQWQPPKPLDIKVFNAMVGEWEGVNDMMGMKMNDHAKIYWALNKQYIIMEVLSVGVDKPDTKYSGMAVFGVDKDGKIKSWWFDDWGSEFTMPGTGTLSDAKMTVNSVNSMMKDDRTYEVNGNEMTMTATSTWTENGKEMKMDSKSVYKKK